MDMVGFVPEPHSGRGTMGIIWSCLTTIFLSTWTSYHMDFTDTSVKTKIYEVAVSVFFPEVFAAGALEESINAWYFRKAMRLIPGWERFSMKQAFLIQKNCVTIQTQNLITSDGLFDRARSGNILFHQLPQNSQIDARSKSDWLSKMIAICQALWFVSNIASRLVAGYEISLLEGLTTAYVFCGLIMFISWYQCPQDVKEKFDLQNQDNHMSNDGEKNKRGLKTIGNTMFAFGGVFFIAIFTSIHLAAWNYAFASTAEAWIWRVLSIATFILGLGCLSYWAFEYTSSRMVLGVAVTTIVYFFVRLGVMALAFIAFRHAPAGIYLTTRWPAYWNDYIASQALYNPNGNRPSLTTIAEFVSLCYIILLAILLEVEDRRETAKANVEMAGLMKTLPEICSSVKMLKANHITRSPWFLDDSGCPPPCQILQPSCKIPGNCETDHTSLECDDGIAALFELHHGSTASTKNPASVLASLTTTEKSDESTSTSTKRNSLETGSLKNRDGAE